MVTGEGEWSNKNTNRPPVKLLKLSCFLKDPFSGHFANNVLKVKTSQYKSKSFVVAVESWYSLTHPAFALWQSESEQK